MVSSQILQSGQWMLVNEFVIVSEFLSNSIKYCLTTTIPLRNAKHSACYSENATYCEDEM
jgi:hypothetical protein